MTPQTTAKIISTVFVAGTVAMAVIIPFPVSLVLLIPTPFVCIMFGLAWTGKITKW